MHATPAFRVLPFALAAAVAIGCTPNDSTGPGNPPPPPGSVFAWSDTRAWPGGVLPVSGGAVEIPAGVTVLLDQSPPPLASLTVHGTLRFEDRDLDLTAGWIVVHGRFEIGTEAAPYQRKAVITLTGPSTDNILGMGAKVFGVKDGTLELHGKRRVSWTRLNQTAAAGATQLVLAGPVDWLAGDRIVVASTDFDPLQAEELVITAVQGNTVTLQAVLRYRHYGETQSFAGRVLDQRAEVGLLTRHIVIQGDSTSLTAGFGGHVIVMLGSSARVEGVEFTRMGQRQQLARYPMHWHLAQSVTGQYFRDNSVWKTFNRCLTIHGTNDLVAERNVCYDNLGHAFFLEDGAEVRNQLIGNLGLGTKRPVTGQEVLPSDLTPATFWLTNPDNIIRGNVAAGSRGFGFWYAFPAAPTGLSTGSTLKPRQTPLGEFSDNVAHSNSNTGLNVDHGPRPDGTIETVHYSPRQVPGQSSPAVTAYFRNFTGWKHPGRAVWLRGTELRLAGGIFADNAIGATFASNETFVQDALFIGLSAIGGSTPGVTFPIRGYEFYDGRVGAERVTFVNYSAAGRTMSALGFNRANGFPVNTGNFGKQLVFQGANGVFLEDPRADRDGDKAAVILDVDGSITGTAGYFVAANNPLLVTPACTRRDAWNAWVCTSRFVNLQVRGASGQVVAPLDLVRDDAVTTRYVGVPDNPQVVSSSVPTGRRFAVRYVGGIPDRPQVYLNRAAPADWVLVEVPHPTGTVNVYRDYNTSQSLPAAASRAAVEAGTGDNWYWDAPAGVLVIKAMAKPGRDWGTWFVVPK